MAKYVIDVPESKRSTACDLGNSTVLHLATKMLTLAAGGRKCEIIVEHDYYGYRSDAYILVHNNGELDGFYLPLKHMLANGSSWVNEDCIFLYERILRKRYPNPVSTECGAPTEEIRERFSFN